MRSLRGGLALALLAACGRIGFEPSVECDSSAPAIRVTVEPRYPANGGAWNDHVAPGAQDAPCASSGRCVHGGELRTVEVASQATCGGLAIRDELAAFEWTCVDAAGTATFVSTGLREDKGLADLVDAQQWRPNGVAITCGSSEVARSEPAAWWTNPVTPLPDNAASPALALNRVDDDGAGPDAAYAPGTIFTLAASRTSSGYVLDEDRLAIVTLPGAALAYAGSAQNNCSWGGELGVDISCLLSAGTQAHLWVEGDYDGGQGVARPRDTVRFYDVDHSVFRRLTVTGASHAGFSIVSDSSYNEISQLVAAVSDLGVELDAAYDNIVQRVTATNNVWAGVAIFMAENNSLSQLLVSSNDQYGLLVQDARANTANHVLAAGNGINGIYMSGAVDNTLTGLVAINNSSSGLRISTSTDNALSELLLAHNSYGLDIDGASSRNLFAGSVWVGSNATSDCMVAAGTSNIEPGCQESDPDLSIVTGASLADSFGPNLPADARNADRSRVDANGILDGALVTDWVHFEDALRTWGLGVTSDALAGANRGTCAAARCAIRDWRPLASDRAMLGFFGRLVPESRCPDAAGPGRAITDRSAAANTFVAAAIELVRDGAGDDDGLCESSERCVFAPNLGPYQGHGDFRTQRCELAPGATRDVVMYGYPTNGR